MLRQPDRWDFSNYRFCACALNNMVWDILYNTVGRTSDARPYDNAVFSNYAAVGAAIGRPSVNIRSDEKKSASAVKTIPVITGRATEKSAAAVRTSNARPYGWWVNTARSFRQW